MRESSWAGRTRVLALVLVAAFALAGVVASGASAAPEWKGCVKTVPKNTGRYTDKLCTAESPTGEGAYELVPSVGKGKGFKGNAGATTLHTIVPPCEAGGCEAGAEDLEVTCTSASYEGKLALPNLIREAVITFKGCSELGSPCESGSKKGTIVTNDLAGEMVDIEGGSGVGSLLEAEAGPPAPLATFYCRDLWEVNLLGSVIAERTGDVGVISREAQEHFVVARAVGEVRSKGKEEQGFKPLVNVPTHVSGGAIGEHILRSELSYGSERETLDSGLEGVVDEKGEALLITP